jgi:hypothetical protein
VRKIGLQFGAPAPGAAFEDVGVMQEPIEERRDRGGVSEELPPVIDRPVGGQQRRRAFVAPHDQLEEVFGGGVRELAHAEIVDLCGAPHNLKSSAISRLSAAARTCSFSS